MLNYIFTIRVQRDLRRSANMIRLNLTNAMKSNKTYSIRTGSIERRIRPSTELHGRGYN